MAIPADILRAARAKIADPKRWTRGEYARDAHGDPVDAQSDYAVCWCARGAIYAVDFKDEARHGLKPLHDAVEERRHGVGVVYFNDHADHDEVLAAFDRAIELAEGRP